MKAYCNDSALVKVLIVIAANGLASPFADADESIEGVSRRWLTTVQVLVDETANQCSKTDAATPCLVTELPVLLGLE